MTNTPNNTPRMGDEELGRRLRELVCKPGVNPTYHWDTIKKLNEIWPLLYGLIREITIISPNTNTTTTSTNEDWLDEILKICGFNVDEYGNWYYPTSHGFDIGRGTMAMAKAQIKAHIKKIEVEAVAEARQQRLLDFMASKDPVEVMQFLAVTIYLYVMEPTNAFVFETTLENFNRKDVVLGDFTIKAELTSKAPKHREGK